MRHSPRHRRCGHAFSPRVGWTVSHTRFTFLAVYPAADAWTAYLDGRRTHLLTGNVCGSHLCHFAGQRSRKQLHNYRRHLSRTLFNHPSRVRLLPCHHTPVLFYWTQLDCCCHSHDSLDATASWHSRLVSLGRYAYTTLPILPTTPHNPTTTPTLDATDTTPRCLHSGVAWFCCVTFQAPYRTNPPPPPCTGEWRTDYTVGPNVETGVWTRCGVGRGPAHPQVLDNTAFIYHAAAGLASPGLVPATFYDAFDFQTPSARV